MSAELLQIRRIVLGDYNTTMKVVNTIPGIGNLMAEEERKDFLTNDENKLFAPDAISDGCYFDVKPNLKQRSREKRNGLFVGEELEGDLI